MIRTTSYKNVIKTTKITYILFVNFLYINGFYLWAYNCYVQYELI